MKTHGLSKTPTYAIWSGMISRCRLTHRKQASMYAGKGIRVCERWQSFENFLADMGERPPGKTLDRYPDNDGNYEPGNCRWATPKEQRANSSQALHLVTYRGETMNLRDWAAHFGLKYATVYARFMRGNPPEGVFRPARAWGR